MDSRLTFVEKLAALRLPLHHACLSFARMLLELRWL
jgi:hypothetical protein